jgi:MFS family permease
LVSLYAFGIIIGRFACGLALDRWPTHIVGAVSMSLPAIGLFIFASDLTEFYVLAVAVLLLGLSQGAEGDLAAYLVARYFGIEIFSTVLGLVVATISGATALGAGVLSITLAATDGYVLFLLMSGTAVLTGGTLFLALAWQREHRPDTAKT